MHLLRCSVLVLSVALLFNACKKEEAQPQAPLVTNGDIEQKYQGWFFNFSTPNQANPNGYDQGFTAESAASPQYSLKINCNTVKNDSAFCYYGQQNIPIKDIPVAAKLTLKAKIKTVNMKGSGVSLVIRGDKDGKTAFFMTTQGKMSINDVKEFTEYSVTVDSFPGNVDNLLFFLVYLPKTTGSVYFDDVSLTVN
ncbi:hypothetical protein J2I47_23900 [Fibrella sp. HMF5335]|uniref:Carbohydrate binding domain-containing protein n=1 Tax=Fibrella rubiginis TaxID=2817060 RepID=A0A939GMM9_9BACT|nr:hypothetical protein [Fibrella rubiginis]MBO0939615.1 hypothetical protein [Fibrella rubiginis]